MDGCQGAQNPKVVGSNPTPATIDLNGNTLICEGFFGRIFEVKTDGVLVWELVNPYFGDGTNDPNNRVFRACRYSAEEIARAKATGGAA